MPFVAVGLLQASQVRKDRGNQQGDQCTEKVLEGLQALESVARAKASRGEDVTLHEMPKKKTAAKKTAKKQPAKKAAARKSSRSAWPANILWP